MVTFNGGGGGGVLNPHLGLLVFRGNIPNRGIYRAWLQVLVGVVWALGVRLRA